MSTYELGHQPWHIASPAARLGEAGHDVRALDLAVEPWRDSDFDWAEAVGFSVPMHTAMRLAVEGAVRVRKSHPGLPIAFYGLYAAVSCDRVVGALADLVIAGEYENELVEWVTGPSRSSQPVVVDIGRMNFLKPARDRLPPLESYAHLQWQGSHRLVGYVEGSHGCRHRCRHCPIPSVYDGRYRVVGLESVLADIDQLVEMGAEHITMGDPDFLNAPPYSRELLTAAHRRHPQLTFDVTVKVEHVLAHEKIWSEWRELGVIFVVSAFETTNDRILAMLDKGHTTVEAARAVEILREAGIEVRPSWMPFTPWTEPDDLPSIFRFLDDNQLFENVDPVQMTIRLLAPEGSLLVERFPSDFDHYDARLLTYQWRPQHPATGELADELARIAEAASANGEDSVGTLESMWSTCEDRPVSATRRGVTPPRLTEPWFC